MQNTNFTKFENELISYFIWMHPKISNIITSQFETAKNIKRDFTSIWSFISFDINSTNILVLKDFNYTTFDWPDINSSELKNWAYTLFFFTKYGIFDYIEIVWKYWDFPERELQNYIISKPEPINIIKSI